MALEARLDALSPEHVRALIILATRYRGRTRRGRTRHGTFEVRAAAYADDVESTAKQDLFRAIKRLDPLARQEVTALVWIGLGVYRPDEWAAAVRYAGANQTDADLRYMLENGPIEAHLTQGLERLAIRIPGVRRRSGERR